MTAFFMGLPDCNSGIQMGGGKGEAHGPAALLRGSLSPNPTLLLTTQHNIVSAYQAVPTGHTELPYPAGLVWCLDFNKSLINVE